MQRSKEDRHKNRVRTYPTGAEKKRIAKEEARKAEEDVRKSRKISEFVIVEKRQDQPQTPERGTSCSTEGIEDAEEATSAVSDDVDLVTEDQVETEDVNASDSGSPEDDAEDEGPPGGNDIGLWPAIIPEQMREY